MKHNYSFVQTLNYIKSVAPKYHVHETLYLDSEWGETQFRRKLGNFHHYINDIEKHFGIKLSKRTDLQICTVRDLVLAIYRLSHEKTK